MRRVDVDLGQRSYPILIEEGLIGRAETVLGRGRAYVVSDRNLALRGHTATLEHALARSEVEHLGTYILPPGEETKSLEQLGTLLDALLDKGLERGDHLIALGGGVVGDLTGFAAAILKRGCKYIQVPTTLLAQVDSSVGGKTGINMRQGKNLVGAFHQPAAVLIDPATLDTLPERELRAGYAEVVKYGLIGDPEFYSYCEAHVGALFAGDPEARLHAIETSVRAKARIVAADEHETSGLRALLNFGHTFGHALEAETGFGERLLHGEAVALGMALAFRFSAQRGLCTPEDADRIAAHLREAGLPTRLPDIGVDQGARLTNYMASDKKMRAGRLPFILTRGIGEAFVDKSVSLLDVAAFLDREAQLG